MKQTIPRSQFDTTGLTGRSAAQSQRAPLDLTFAEYFAGIGLVRMGLEVAGWSPVFANDFSPKKHQMFSAFFPESSDHYIIGDIFSLDYATIPLSTLATCSFPCIDLSLAGNMQGISGRHSSAFWGFIAALEAQGSKAPHLLLVENVPGWLSSNRGNDFRATVEALNQLGYSCDVFALDALRFTPQSRERIFLVGVRPPLPPSDPLRILERSNALSSARLRSALVANSDLQWIYLDIPEPPPMSRLGLAAVLENVPDSAWWPDQDVRKHLAMMSDSHSARVASLAALPTTSYRAFYRRRRSGQMRAEVRDDDMAGCLRTAIGGSSRQFIVAAGGGSVAMRDMTPREYARLQGVPDSYPIDAPKNQALTGFGDAVCVPAIAWIAANILNPLVETTLASSVAQHASSFPVSLASSAGPHLPGLQPPPAASPALARAPRS